MCHTARVPVLVTVTPVNEFRPACPSGATFTVPETAAFGSIVGRVAGTDRDYPLDSLEYSLEGGSGPAQPFSIDRRTGEHPAPSPAHATSHGTYGFPAAHTSPQARFAWWDPWAPSSRGVTGWWCG